MDAEPNYIPRWGPMFTNGSLAKADLATNLAIPLVAEGGWGALTLRNVARAANVTPQAISAWFPSVTAMRIAVAARYGDRWIRERRYLARRLISQRQAPSDVGSDIEVAQWQAALALVPATWLEAVFDGVWLAVVEAGRWDAEIGAAVGRVEELERDLVLELLSRRTYSAEAELERDADVVLALARGMRVARTSPHEPMSIERAEEVLSGSFSGGRT